jgi:hypothetical protein
MAGVPRLQRALAVLVYSGNRELHSLNTIFERLGKERQAENGVLPYQLTCPSGHGFCKDEKCLRTGGSCTEQFKRTNNGLQVEVPFASETFRVCIVGSSEVILGPEFASVRPLSVIFDSEIYCGPDPAAFQQSYVDGWRAIQSYPCAFDIHGRAPLYTSLLLHLPPHLVGVIGVFGSDNQQSQSDKRGSPVRNQYPSLSSLSAMLFGPLFLIWGMGWWKGIYYHPYGRGGYIPASLSCTTGAIFWMWGFNGFLDWSFEF